MVPTIDPAVAGGRVMVAMAQAGVSADPLATRSSRALVVVLRVGLALLWIQGASWKVPLLRPLWRRATGRVAWLLVRAS
jgi:hypothetical protein